MRVLFVSTQYIVAHHGLSCKPLPNRIPPITKASAIASQWSGFPGGPRIRSPQTSPYPPASSAPCRAFSLI